VYSPAISFSAPSSAGQYEAQERSTNRYSTSSKRMKQF
jgi:hypothetical protein